MTDYEDYKQAWLDEALGMAQNNVEVGSYFAQKLFRQWRGLDEDAVLEDLHHCDGAYDGGIDLAYLDRAEDDESGSTWYLVQSKYGSSLSGPDTIISEGHKVLTTLEGLRGRLNRHSTDVLDKVSEFIRAKGPEDRLVIVFLTENPLTRDEILAVENVRSLGRQKFGVGFEVEQVSIKTIFDLQTQDGSQSSGVRVNLPANLITAGDDLLVGSISILGLHDFLSNYKTESRNLNRIFERNVRQYLGARPANRKMRETLRDVPEYFGMYNNGITIVVRSWEKNSDGSIKVVEPFIVNGCQTANCVWQEVERRVNNGSTGTSAETEDWKLRAQQGSVIVKVVRTGDAGAKLMAEITRHTNTQTAVKGKDFISLNEDFQRWQTAFEREYGIYLEIQAGGWEARKTLQKRSRKIKQITDFTSAQNLLKFYAAAWEKDPGTAYRTAKEFTPGGKFYESIVNQDGFGKTDLYAAWLLFRHATGTEYGYGSRKKAEYRAYTKFLFSYAVMELLEHVMNDKKFDLTPLNRTRVLTAVLSDDAARKALLDEADGAIKMFFTPGDGDSYHDDPVYQNRFGGNLNEYLKWKELVSESREFSEQMRLARRSIIRAANPSLWAAVEVGINS